MADSVKEVNERYSGLVTVLAVLIMVEYAEGKYDCWDSFLGTIGFILAFKYSHKAKTIDRFYKFLVSSLYAISVVCIIGGLKRCKDLPNVIEEKTVTEITSYCINQSFTWFFLITLVAYIVLSVFLKHKKVERNQER